MPKYELTSKELKLVKYLKTEIRKAQAEKPELTYEFIADELGITQTLLSDCLNGKVSVNLDLFIRLASILDLPLQPWLSEHYQIELPKNSNENRRYKRESLDLEFGFKYLGKVKGANITVRPFTVIAGCNSSGKSFITKMLYSLFSFNPEREAEIEAENLTKMLRNLDDEFKEKFLKMLKSTLDTTEVTTSSGTSKTAKLSQHLLENFMAKNLKELINFKYKAASVWIDEHDDLLITQDGVSVHSHTLKTIHNLSPHPPVYIESPIYWKLSEALRSAKSDINLRAASRGLKRDEVVNQVPKYFYDTLDLLELQVRDDTFNDLAKEIEKSINGNLSIDNGNIHFKDHGSGQSVGLSLTALGVTNLGMIALLLRKGAILPGTFLFIDEPEVHLHPSWQMIFVDILYKLSKRGVNVVIASHSIDIMKAIENIMESDDSQQTHFGINQLSSDGASVEVSESNFKRIASIKEDLGNPFYEMTMEGWYVQ